MHGVLVIDKPGGMTSADVVRRAKRALRVKKIGHTGTLDPMATGVLPLVVGDGTKIASYLLADDKAYRATVELGVETDTLDADGDMVGENRAAAAALDPAAIRDACRGFVGELDQVPPMYSALKKDGVRLHELARAGETVAREPRRIHIHRLELTRCEPPELELELSCSKGTYVRALARDLGAALDVGAHLRALRRTRAGRFGIEQAIALDQLDRDRASETIIGLGQALDHLPAVSPSLEHLARIATGLPREAAELAPGFAEGQRFRCLTPALELAAIAYVAGPEVRYDRVFPTPRR